MNESVFVSGATGFLALTLVKKLIEKGYNVVGSVRSVDKGERLKRLLLSDKFCYEVVEAMEKEGSFDSALMNHPEVTVFLHTASPFHFNADNAADIEKELLLPAIEGTKNVFKAIQKYAPQIRKVVFTSSTASMFINDRMADSTLAIDETLWNPMKYEESLTDGHSGYIGSKVFAEKAAWDFIKNEHPNFSLAVINPVLIYGPQALDEDVKETLNKSAEVVNSILRLNKEDDLFSASGWHIDVRDVADAHIVAFENPKAENQRFLLAEQPYDSQMVLDIIRNNFPELKEKLPIGNPGSKEFENVYQCLNQKTREILGFKFIKLEESVIDAVNQILRVRKQAK